jgi:hypothetical protein
MIAEDHAEADVNLKFYGVPLIAHCILNPQIWFITAGRLWSHLFCGRIWFASQLETSYYAVCSRRS